VTAELTGTPGVVLTGIGPGAASAVNGIAYAYLEKAPVLLITDGPASSLHQAFDQNALFAPVTKLQGRLRPDDGAAGIEAALRTAMTPPWGPVQFELTAGDARAAAGRAEAAELEASAEPGAESVIQARALLATSRKPVIIAGLEARHGDNPHGLRRLADALACPVLLTYKAKGVLPDSNPGVAGLFTGAVAEGEILRDADLIVLYGYDPVEAILGSWDYDAPVLDLTAFERPAERIEPACRVVGTLAELAAALTDDAPAGDWTPERIAALHDALAERIALPGNGHTAETVTDALAAAAPPGCRLTVDAGAHMFSALTRWPAEQPFGVLKSNGLSTMGFALPAAVASALEEPDRPVLAFTGDGGLLMCLSELATAMEHGCNLVVAVINDAALSLIDIKQSRQQYRSRGVHYPAIDFAACAKALGCAAWRVEADEPLAPVLEQAFAASGPALVDITVDPGGYIDQLEALRG
jgi:acetolactate synthase-1/2/3 large subunit